MQPGEVKEEEGGTLGTVWGHGAEGDGCCLR